MPRLENELVALRGQLASEQALRAKADKAAAVAEAQRAAEEAARQRAETQLGNAEARESQTRQELAEAHAAHEATREKLTEAVGLAAGAQAELKELRAHIEATAPDLAADGGQPKGEARAAETKSRKTPPAGEKP